MVVVPCFGAEHWCDCEGELVWKESRLRDGAEGGEENKITPTECEWWKLRCEVGFTGVVVVVLTVIT